MARPLGSGAQDLPTCPEPAHAGGRVTLNGRYGTPERERQRFRSYPPSAGPPHNFAGALTHQVVRPGEVCAHCEQHLAEHQGHTAPRDFEVPVQEIARALWLVGRGVSYTEAGQRCRIRVGKAPRGEGRAQMVGSWVEAFTPVVAARWAEPLWPERVILDSTHFKGNLPGGGSGRIYYVYVVCAWDPIQRQSRVISLVPRPREDGATWEAVLRSRPNQPEMVVADKATALQKSIPVAWPNTTWRLCRWHLRSGAEALNYQLRFSGIDLNLDHPITSRAKDCFNDLAHWTDFRRMVNLHGSSEMKTWVRNQNPWLRAEFAEGLTGQPWSNGAAELALTRVKAAIAKRAFCYKNLERTALMLELVRLRLNRMDDETVYARDIRAFLEGGGQLAPTLSLRDPLGRPSLRP